MRMNQIKFSLFFMRISVFIVFLVWSLDKFLNPGHTTKVFQHFYFSPAFDPSISYAIGCMQIAITFGFVLGIKRTWTYGAILIMHFISTVSSYAVYAQPWKTPNILFFAALPMLAACYALFVLRDQDTFLSCGR